MPLSLCYLRPPKSREVCLNLRLHLHPHLQLRTPSRYSAANLSRLHSILFSTFIFALNNNVLPQKISSCLSRVDAGGIFAARERFFVELGRLLGYDNIAAYQIWLIEILMKHRPGWFGFVSLGVLQEQ